MERTKADTEERRRDILGGAGGPAREDWEARGDQVHEEEIRDSEPGEQAARDPGAEDDLPAREHHPADRDPLVGAPEQQLGRRAAGHGLRADGQEPLRADLGPRSRHHDVPGQVHNLQSAAGAEPHAQERHIPPRHQAVAPAHRSENILVRGEKEVKLADFGCCKGVFAEAPHTEYISTRWYRPPECLLTDGYYDSKVGAREQIDIWGVGCVLYEIITGDPLFKGEDEMDQINKIHDVMGTPHPEVLAFYQEYQGLTRLASHMEFNFEEKKGAGLRAMLPEDRSSEDLLDLLARMLAYEPHTRISAGEALRHPFFLEVVEKEMELEKSTL